MGMTMLSAKDRWLLATMTGPSRGTFSRPSTCGRQTALATGGTIVCTTSYNIATPPAVPDPTLPGGSVRRGTAAVRTGSRDRLGPAQGSNGSLGCGGPSVGSTPSNRLLTDSPACTRE